MEGGEGNNRILRLGSIAVMPPRKVWAHRLLPELPSLR
jgi:hypothetical protein